MSREFYHDDVIPEKKDEIIRMALQQSKRSEHLVSKRPERCEHEFQEQSRP